MIRLINILNSYGVLVNEIDAPEGLEGIGFKLQGKTFKVFKDMSKHSSGFTLQIHDDSSLVVSKKAYVIKDLLELIGLEQLEEQQEAYLKVQQDFMEFIEPYKAKRITFKEKHIELVGLFLLNR